MKVKAQKRCKKILKKQSLKPQFELPYGRISRYVHYLNVCKRGKIL